MTKRVSEGRHDFILFLNLFVRVPKGGRSSCRFIHGGTQLCCYMDCAATGIVGKLVVRVAEHEGVYRVVEEIVIWTLGGLCSV